MEPGLIWLLGGFLLLGAELALPGVFLVWVGLAAVLTGLVVLAADPGFGIVTICFIVFLILGITAGIRLGRHKRKGSAVGPNEHGAGLIGRIGTVISVEPVGMRVRLGDSDWAARFATGNLLAAPKPGQTVRVETVEGTVLVVTPAP
ncbi:NfeD family protein [Acetobacteraceae bacterium H6797]|nr:NfeD family protein [Acetobacteraceae bacterium H6797]